MRVEGIDERGRKVKVVMHYSALEVVIGTADAPPSGEKRKRSIGFQALEGWPRGKPPPAGSPPEPFERGVDRRVPLQGRPNF